MKKLAIAALAVTLSSSLYATEYGVGVTIYGEDGDSIYAPINIGNDLRVEPFISIYSYDWNQRGTTANDYEYSGLDIGTGVFKINRTSDNTNVLLGVRIGYFEDEYDYSTTEEHYRGYMVAPVLGFEYFPVRNFSVGGDVAVQIRDGSSTSDTNPSSDYDSRRTTTQLNVKYYFN